MILIFKLDYTDKPHSSGLSIRRKGGETIAVMDLLIARDIFLAPSGALTEIRDIKVIDTTTSVNATPG
ncbi:MULTISPECIES: DUF2922 domain-containing protein [unclassified Dehalobacter]|uniref:DUF2922 domain-containing protein n=1 Tax=unclassified Dehalobacter TaxID=2635733 RepID=UPI000EE434DB|nr:MULTISPECIES: DUF2922 domain-containing protein [unclassified Dehalobacter]RJE48424.1 hypothetical protein A7K50_11120 [Dehalobacter sp. MCB1]